MSTPDYSDFLGDRAPQSNDLGNLSELIAQLEAAEDAVKEAEDELRRRQAIVRSLAEHDIPEVMMAVGIDSFKTTSGTEVSIKKDIRASIPVAQRERAYQWLEENGFSGLIKREIRVGFRRDEGEQAMRLLEELGGQYANTAERQEVHPSTLKAWVKERLAEGDDIPMELFGAFEVNRAKIKRRS